jgi:outer membrane protein W
VIVVVDLAVSHSWAQPLPFNQRHQAGVRLGVWANTGEMPPESDSLGTFETAFSDASVYFEFFASLRMTSFLMGELSFGMTNRGRVTFIEAGGSNIGHVLVHPILLSLKFYPFTPFKSKIQPFVTIGGGLYYGRRTVQFTTSNQIATYGLNEDTGTDLNLAYGGGIDWPIGSTIGLEALVRYMPIEFSDGLQSVNNYDALAITVGIKYLFRTEK